MERAAIVGAGSLGTIIGALITKSGKIIELIDANHEHVEKLNKNGATITGFLELNVPVTAYTPEAMEGKYDLIFLLTKRTQNDLVLSQILPHCHSCTVVCTLQNGIPEEEVASVVGANRTVGGTVGFGATFLLPGVSKLTSTKESLEKYAFDIGEIDGSQTPRLQKIKEWLSDAGHCEIVDNLMAIRWTKLLMNATFSGVSAALGCTFGEVLNDERSMYVLAHVADETIKVAHIAGYRLVYMQGIDMDALELPKSGDFKEKMSMYHAGWDRHAQLRPGMLYDLEAGRRSEIDYINGYVCQKGRQYGIPTPFNDKVVELFKVAEQEKQIPKFTVNIEKLACL